MRELRPLQCGHRWGFAFYSFDITTDRAGQLDMCGAALLSLQMIIEYYHYDGRMPLGSSHGGDRGSREWTDGYGHVDSIRSTL